MNKCKRIISLLIMVLVLIVVNGFFSNKEDNISYSDHILFSTNHGASGFGTIADCADATIMVYTDRTVRVFMDVNDNPEIATFTLSEVDYEHLAAIASPQIIYNLKTKDDPNVCDGSSSYITIYDENDEMLVSKGGYMALGKKYNEIYNEIHATLIPYGITEKVEEYRECMRAEFE